MSFARDSSSGERRPRASAVALLLGLWLAPAGCAGARRPEGDRPPFRRVKPPVAFAMLRDNPNLLILDLRRPEEYWGDVGHLHRAKNFPLEDLEARIAELGWQVGRTFLVYCRDDGCGEQGMRVLLASGLGQAVLIEGGIEAWVQAGFLTVGKTAEPGGEVSSAEEQRGRGDVPGQAGGPAKRAAKEKAESSEKVEGRAPEEAPGPTAAATSAWLIPANHEIQLALSAAPEEVAREASVYLLAEDGYRKVREGSNGFGCMVRRWGYALALQPICFDAEASATVLPVYQFRVEGEMAGRDRWEIEREIEEGFATGRFRAPSRPCIAYAFSREQRVFDPASGRLAPWYPHVMLYFPNLTNREVGASPGHLGDVPLPFVMSEGKPDSYIVIPIAPPGAGYAAGGAGDD